MITILEESSLNLKGLRNFRNITWGSSNNIPNSRTKTFWNIQTNFRKFKFIEWLKLDSFFREDRFSMKFRCLMDSPGILGDDLFVSSLLAKEIVSDQELLLNRLNFLRSLENLRPWSRNLLSTLDGVIKFRISERRIPIRKGPKYSGYVRNPSAVGSKFHKPRNFEPETVEWINIEDINFLHFLTVGELTTGTPGSFVFTPKMAKKPKR